MWWYSPVRTSFIPTSLDYVWMKASPTSSCGKKRSMCAWARWWSLNLPRVPPAYFSTEWRATQHGIFWHRKPRQEFHLLPRVNPAHWQLVWQFALSSGSSMEGVTLSEIRNGECHQCLSSRAQLKHPATRHADAHLTKQCSQRWNPRSPILIPRPSCYPPATTASTSSPHWASLVEPIPLIRPSWVSLTGFAMAMARSVVSWKTV